jgi:hypothetical protein
MRNFLSIYHHFFATLNKGGAEAHKAIDNGRSDELGSVANWKKLEILTSIKKRPTFSGVNWKSKFTRVSRDL